MDFPVNKIKGLSTRQNNIDQNEFFCIDCDNVRTDKNNVLVKIDGFVDRGLSGWGDIIDAYYISHSDEIFIVETVKFSRITNSSRASAQYEELSFFPDSVGYVNDGTKLSFTEINKNLYIADPNGFSSVMKYDGQRVYMSGVKVPSFSTSGVGENKFTRVWVSNKDRNGIETMGDYSQQLALYDAGNISITVNYPYEKIGAKFVLDDFATLLTDPSKQFTFEASSTNLKAGDIIYFNADSVNPAGGFPIVVEVKSEIVSVTGSGPYQVVVDYSGYKGETPLTMASFKNSFSNTRVYVAKSDNSTFGYRYAPSSSTESTNFMIYEDSSTLDIPSAEFSSEMEDIYDTTIIKASTPRFKYITSFGNQMVGVIDDFTIAWSDSGLGSSCETFAPFDTERFGKSDEGVITGIFGGDSFVSVFKESEIYHIQGILYGRQYRIVKDSSSGVGCAGHATIIRYGGGCLFMSDKGIYYSNGQLSQEITDHIEGLIEPLQNKDRIRSVQGYNDERIYFVSSDFSFEFDYYHNNWWKHSLYSDSVYFTNRSNVFSKIDSSGFYVSAPSVPKYHTGFYRTSWMSMGDPFKEKKFNYFCALSTYGVNFSASIEEHYNWGEGVESSYVKSFNENERDFIQKFGTPNKKALSASFSVKSDSGEDMSISGFLIDYETYQTKVRA